MEQLRSFTPWRDIMPDADIDPPPFADQAAASKFVLREASAAVDQFVGYGQGFAGHMLTFGQSLIELAAMGDVEWAEICRTAFRKYVTVTRRGPEPDAKRIADHRPNKLRSTDTEYWQKRSDRSLEIGHVFKYPYSYYDLLQRAKDPRPATRMGLEGASRLLTSNELSTGSFGRFPFRSRSRRLVGVDVRRNEKTPFRSIIGPNSDRDGVS